MLDLHAAPGNQNGDTHGGCHVEKPYWDTTLNKDWSLQAVRAIADICRVNKSCYGVEILNEPGAALSRKHLIEFSQQALLLCRDVGLPMETPVIIMDWAWLWFHYSHRWYNLFPKDQYGETMFDTHIYYFEKSVEAEEEAWNLTQWPPVKLIADEKSVPIMIGEYTLSLGADLPYDEAQGWAEYV